MGMYTMLAGEMKLKPDTPKRVWDALVWMSDNKGDRELYQYDHPLFKLERSDFMLLCTSSYFDDDEYVHQCVVDPETRDLKVGFNMKNYESEIEAFLDFVGPYVESSENLRMRYEEYELPTIISFVGNKPVYIELENS